MATRIKGGAGTSRLPRRGAYIFGLAAAIRRRKAQAARGRSPRSGLTSAHTVSAPAPKRRCAPARAERGDSGGRPRPTLLATGGGCVSSLPPCGRDYFYLI